MNSSEVRTGKRGMTVEKEFKGVPLCLMLVATTNVSAYNLYLQVRSIASTRMTTLQRRKAGAPTLPPRRGSTSHPVTENVNGRVYLKPMRSTDVRDDLDELTGLRMKT